MAELARARPGHGGSLPESGDGGSLLRLEGGGAGQSSEMAKLAGARDGGTSQGSETAELERALRLVELARRSETVSRPELRDGETGQSSCFCLFIGVFGRVNCSWIGNSGAGKGSETAGWPGARRRRSSSGLGDSGDGQSSDLGDGGALLGLGDGEVGRGSEMEELASASQRRWKGLRDSGAGKGSETAKLVRAPRRWS